MESDQSDHEGGRVNAIYSDVERRNFERNADISGDTG